MITFSPREQKKLLREWHTHYAQLSAAYEPVYSVRRQQPVITDDGKKLLLTSWINGRASILPPADVVAIILHDHDHQTLSSYLIGQPELFGLIDATVTIEKLPTRFFQVERLTSTQRQAIVSRALLHNQTPFSLDSATAVPPVDYPSPALGTETLHPSPAI